MLKIIESDDGARSWRSTGPWLRCYWCFIGCSSFHVVHEEHGVPLLCSMVLSRFVSCSRLGADLTFHVSARFRITVQSLHSLKGPPISRLSAPLSLPCAFTVFPLSPCSVVCVILLLAGFLSCCPFFLSWLLL